MGKWLVRLFTHASSFATDVLSCSWCLAVQSSKLSAFCQADHDVSPILLDKPPREALCLEQLLGLKFHPPPQSSSGNRIHDSSLKMLEKKLSAPCTASWLRPVFKELALCITKHRWGIEIRFELSTQQQRWAVFRKDGSGGVKKGTSISGDHPMKKWNKNVVYI